MKWVFLLYILVVESISWQDGPLITRSPLTLCRFDATKQIFSIFSFAIFVVGLTHATSLIWQVVNLVRIRAAHISKQWKYWRSLTRSMWVHRFNSMAWSVHAWVLSQPCPMHSRIYVCTHFNWCEDMSFSSREVPFLCIFKHGTGLLPLHT